jgi:diguanylate cyclase (GGDEF)-like protein/PAS domain S-box-containing protein
LHDDDIPVGGTAIRLPDTPVQSAIIDTGYSFRDIARANEERGQTMNNTASELIRPQSNRTEPRNLSYSGYLLLLIWSSLVATSLYVSLQDLKAQSIELNLSQGRNLFRLIESILIRNTGHGGIYVLQTPRDQPNRIKPVRSTLSGVPLALLDSSLMTRQIADVIERESGIRIRLTSLAPVNPKNRADTWETLALQTFKSGVQKEGLFVNEDVARYIAPLYMKPACLSCHRGNRAGDIGGALSVQWSAIPDSHQMRSAAYRSIASHTAVWLLISALMLVAIRKITEYRTAAAQSQAALFSLNAHLDETIKARARHLLASMHALRTISDNAPGIVYQYLLRPDGSCAIPYANEKFYEVFGLRPEEVHDNAARMLDRLHPDDKEDFIASIQISARDLTPWQYEFRILDTKGRERWLSGNTTPMQDENGLIRWNGFITDITLHKQAEAEMRRHKTIIDTAQDGFWMVDATGNLQEVNQAYADMTGYSTDELLKMHVRDLDASEQSDEIKAHIDRLFTVGHDVFDTRHRHKDGHLIDIEMSATFMRELQTFFVFCRDITRRKEYEKALQESESRYRLLADYDVLTKLPNRRLLADRLGTALAASQRSGSFGALMLLDLDNFKPLNDLHGHDMGDMLLLEVADRLKKCVREVDTVARIGGDEFVVVLAELDSDTQKSREQAMLIAQKIRLSLSAPYVFPRHNVTHHCSASIGVTLFAGHKHTQSDLFKWADIAMYQAKNSGRDQICFHEKSDADKSSPA